MTLGRWTPSRETMEEKFMAANPSKVSSQAITTTLKEETEEVCAIKIQKEPTAGICCSAREQASYMYRHNHDGAGARDEGGADRRHHEQDVRPRANGNSGVLSKEEERGSTGPPDHSVGLRPISPSETPLPQPHPWGRRCARGQRVSRPSEWWWWHSPKDPLGACC